MCFRNLRVRRKGAKNKKRVKLSSTDKTLRDEYNIFLFFCEFECVCVMYV